MFNSSDTTVICLIPCALQKSAASFDSRSGKEDEVAVTAIAFSPRTSCATFKRNVESTPLEKATATLPREPRYFLRFSSFVLISLFCSAIIFYIERYFLTSSIYLLPIVLKLKPRLVIKPISIILLIDSSSSLNGIAM